MSGCRKLLDSEIDLIKTKFKTQRDRTLFIVGYRTGLRISELLSIKIKHIYNFDRVLDYVRLERDLVKSKTEAKEIVLHDEAKNEIEKLLGTFDSLDPDQYLFKSTKFDNKAISRIYAYKVLKGIANGLQLQGKVATHSMRKTLGQKIYKMSGNDLLVTQRALNHKDISSTIRYLDVNKDEVDELILK